MGLGTGDCGGAYGLGLELGAILVSPSDTSLEPALALALGVTGVVDPKAGGRSAGDGDGEWEGDGSGYTTKDGLAPVYIIPFGREVFKNVFWAIVMILAGR